MSTSLQVFREYQGDYQNVGRLMPLNMDMRFSYAPEYMAAPSAKSISLALPLQSEPYSREQTRVFFEGLLPEGNMGRLFDQALHSSDGAYWRSLVELDNESSGALILSMEGSDPKEGRAYRPFDQDKLLEFSKQPHSVALHTGMSSRLSLAGAQAKLGLYHDGDITADHWYQPMGSAPSTHIVKAADITFEHQVINEALCLLTAQYCGFDTAKSSLIPLADSLPLLVVERFDRCILDNAATIDGCRLPRRLHQEDFCQALGLLPYQKYEPTSGHYLSLAANLIRKTVRDPFGDRLMFFNRILFDYLVGNCDNHLKNHSFLWKPDWSTCELSPLYDITCTTIYPGLDREMGVSLCESRNIDDVRRADIREASKAAGIPENVGWGQYSELCDQFPKALKQAEEDLRNQGFNEVSDIADFILEDSAFRRNL